MQVGEVVLLNQELTVELVRVELEELVVTQVQMAQPIEVVGEVVFTLELEVQVDLV